MPNNPNTGILIVSPAVPHTPIILKNNNITAQITRSSTTSPVIGFCCFFAALFFLPGVLAPEVLFLEAIFLSS